MHCASTNSTKLLWQQFAEACRKEKEDVVWDAQIQKAKVLVSVEQAGAGKDEDMSSEDILKKLVQMREAACKQVKSQSTVASDALVLQILLLRAKFGVYYSTH